MTHQEILEGNVLLAEFVGFALRDYDAWEPPDVSWFEDDYYCSHVDFHFHHRWEWLMKVIEKIESIDNGGRHGYFVVNISSNSCTIQGTNLWKSIEDPEGFGLVYCSDPNAVFPTKIESTYYAVVQFIKWYNS